MKVRELLEALDRADPDAEVLATDGGGAFFDITEPEWRHLVHITWPDGSTGWWPSEALTDEDHAVAVAEAEHNVLVLS